MPSTESLVQMKKSLIGSLSSYSDRLNEKVRVHLQQGGQQNSKVHGCRRLERRYKSGKKAVTYLEMLLVRLWCGMNGMSLEIKSEIGRIARASPECGRSYKNHIFHSKALSKYLLCVNSQRLPVDF